MSRLLSPALLVALFACNDEPDTETVTRTVTLPGVTITNTNTNTNTITNTNTNTNTVTNTVTDPDLDGGHFDPPLVELVEIIGSDGNIPVGGTTGKNHQHTSEIILMPGDANRVPMVLDCAYTFQVWNAYNPASTKGILAQSWVHKHTNVDNDGDGLFTKGTVDVVHSGTRDPGCTHLIYDETNPDIVYTSHHGNNSDGDSFISGWDLNQVPKYDAVTGVVNSATLALTQLPMYYETETAFEGLDFEGGRLYAATHAAGFSIFERDPVTNVLTEVGATQEGLENTFDILVDGTTAYVADGPAGLKVFDVSDPANILLIGSVSYPGTNLDMGKSGDTLYMAAESGGIVIIDVSDPTLPVVVNTLPTGGTALGAAIADDRLIVAAWTDVRVYDIGADPHNPTWIGAVRREISKDYGTDEGERPGINNRVLTATGIGDYLYDGTWWTPYTYQIHEGRTAPYLVLPESIQQLTFPGDLALGDSAALEIEVRNDGNEPLTIYDAWSDSPAFTIEPYQMQIPAGGTGVFTLTFSPTIGISAAQLVDPYFDRAIAEETAIVTFNSDDPSQPQRKGYLVGNAAGLGVGDPLPPTSATLPDGSTWDFETDALGSVTVIAYWATFCPVCAHELPDMEAAIWQEYQDDGLKVIALNADNAEALVPQEVWDYIAYINLSFPMGIDEGTTYDTLEAVYDGGNPFPVDIIIDKQGVIQYVAREYDPAEMIPVIETLLLQP